VAVRSKHKKASVSYSATGSANMSSLHASHSDMQKSKLEAKLKQNPTDLTTNFYIDGGATLWTVAFKWPIFKRKKGFLKLSLGLY
jgi:hypothetical protein